MPTCPVCQESNPELGAKCPRCADSYYVYDDAATDGQKDPYIGRNAADKYVVVDEISEGGMGTVYKALQLPVDREVAFKVLRTDLEQNDEIRTRFIREARAVAKIAHPNIIHLHDFGFDDSDHPYMVMEYAPGTNLDEWIYDDDITFGRILHVTDQILSALADAHQEGIVHRDLKPENIIVRGTGTDDDFIKLLDFGIARMVNEQATSGLTKEGEVFGTPHYMSPEQAEGKTDIGPPADVYAVGIMLYEMVCAQTPFDAPKPLSILFKQINDELPPFEARPGLELPEWFAQLVRKATAKSPDERFRNAAEMLEALEAEGGTAAAATANPPGHTAAGIAARDTDGVQVVPDGPTANGPHTNPTAQTQLDATPPPKADGPPPPDGSPPERGHTDSAGNDVVVHDPDPSYNDIDPPDDPYFGLGPAGLDDRAAATVIGAIVVLLAGALAAYLFWSIGSDTGKPGDDTTVAETDGADPKTAVGTAPQVNDPEVPADAGRPDAAAQPPAPADVGTETGTADTTSPETDAQPTRDSEAPSGSGNEGARAQGQATGGDDPKGGRDGTIESNTQPATGGTNGRAGGTNGRPGGTTGWSDENNDSDSTSGGDSEPPEKEKKKDTEIKKFGAPTKTDDENSETTDDEDSGESQQQDPQPFKPPSDGE